MLRTSRSIRNNRMAGFNSTDDMPVALSIPGMANLLLYVSGSTVSGSTWTDLSNSGNDMTLAGSPAPAPATVDGRKSIVFDQMTVKATCAGFLDRSGDYSMYVVCKTGSDLDNIDTNEMMAQSADNRFQLRFSHGQIQYEYSYASNLNDGYVSANTWYRVGLSVTGTTGKIYLNGALSATGSVSKPTGLATTFGVGYFSTDDNFFQGSIAEALVYNTGLSATDFTDLDTYFGF